MVKVLGNSIQEDHIPMLKDPKTRAKTQSRHKGWRERERREPSHQRAASSDIVLKYVEEYLNIHDIKKIIN
jgi:hypothetical protein